MLPLHQQIPFGYASDNSLPRNLPIQQELLFCLHYSMNQLEHGARFISRNGAQAANWGARKLVVEVWHSVSGPYSKSAIGCEPMSGTFCDSTKLSRNSPTSPLLFQRRQQSCLPCISVPHPRLMRCHSLLMGTLLLQPRSEILHLRIESLALLNITSISISLKPLEHDA